MRIEYLETWTIRMIIMFFDWIYHEYYQIEISFVFRILLDDGYQVLR